MLKQTSNAVAETPESKDVKAVVTAAIETDSNNEIMRDDMSRPSKI